MLARRLLPLLEDGQDPTGLAALVAYHLHRNNIGIKQLNSVGLTFDAARKLRQGTLQLNSAFVNQIATDLQLDVSQLTLPLNDEQTAEWSFYRTSARQVTEVWRRVAEASSALNVSQQQLSDLLGIPKGNLSAVLRGERKTPVLNWHQARKIADALGLEEGPEAFISPGFTGQNEVSR
jgi:transcriptional regulator with XRE-family HTH domain